MSGKTSKRRPRGVFVPLLLALSACAQVEGAVEEAERIILGEPQSVGIADDHEPLGTGDVALEPEISPDRVRKVDGKPNDPPIPSRKPREGQIASLAELRQDDVDPETLVGMDFGEIEVLLGLPALQLEEPPAKIWTYNGGSCMFNVFFFPTVGNSVFRVLTYEAVDGAALLKQARARRRLMVADDVIGGSPVPQTSGSEPAKSTETAGKTKDSASRDAGVSKEEAESRPETGRMIRHCFARVLYAKHVPDSG